MSGINEAEDAARQRAEHEALALCQDERDAALAALALCRDERDIATLRGDAWRDQAVKAQTERGPEASVLEGYRERIAELERQRDAAVQEMEEELESTKEVVTALSQCSRDRLRLRRERDDARAESARHAGQLIVACEERDTACAQRDLMAVALARINDESPAWRLVAPWAWELARINDESPAWRRVVPWFLKRAGG